MPDAEKQNNARLGNDAKTALIGLLLLAALLSYHVWDLRAVLTDPVGWWGYFEPVYSGDDYIEVTLCATANGKLRDWHVIHRSITAATIARRMADRKLESVIVPTDLWTLYGDTPDTPTDYDHPGLRDTIIRDFTINAFEQTPYDPVLSQAVIDTWKAEERLEAFPWQVVAVHADEEPTARFVFHTDPSRTWVYVVPEELSPQGGR